MDDTYHYPAPLMSLLVDAIPALCKSKMDVITFFRGAGVARAALADIEDRVRRDRAGIGKHEMARLILTRINELSGNDGLRQRREVLKRVTEWEDFTTSWPNDVLKAKALAADISKLIHVRDSFTRMQDERDAEVRKRQREIDATNRQIRERQERLDVIKTDLFSLISMADPWKRGKALESVLNRLFREHSILVREAFVLKGKSGHGIVEQIDGVIELDGHLYLVEMKWWSGPLGPGDVAQHLVRVFTRGHARGMFIASSGYTSAALDSCKESLQKAVFVLCELEELVRLMDQRADLKEFLRAKIRVAIVDKQPFHRPFV